MKTYENDKDISPLLNTELSDELVLDFFFKKGGKVNINNLQAVLSIYGRKQIAQNLVNLKEKGLIKFVDSFNCKLTYKARWEKTRDSKTLIWAGLICGIIAFLILLLQVMHIL